MSAHSAPGAQHKRFAAYLDRLAQAAGHLDRAVPLKSYCTGLRQPGERKSVEPMASRLCPDNVRQAHQSLHHVVAHAPWSDEDLLEQVRRYVLPVMQKQGPVVAWVVDDAGFVKTRNSLRRSGATVLWAGGQARELPYRSEFVTQHGGSESADRVASLFTGNLDPGQETEKGDRHTRGGRVSNQAGNCLATDPRCRRSTNSLGSGVGGRRLRQ